MGGQGRRNSYSGLATLNISLDNGNNNTFNIVSTRLGTTTNILDGMNNGIINVESTAGPTNITATSGSSVINIGPVTFHRRALSMVSRVH